MNIDVDNLMAAIAHRRSLGLARLTDQPVERSLIEKALEAANWAPSHDETEPWRFTVFTGDSRIALGEAFGEAYRANNTDSFQQSTFENYRDRGLRSPVWVSIAVSPALNPDGSLLMSEEEEAMAVAMAVQNMHLVLSAMGLAGMWSSGFPYRDAGVAKFLGLEAPERLLGFFFFGWPSIDWPKAGRKPLSEKVTWAEG